MKSGATRRGFLTAAAFAGISVYVVRKVGAGQPKSPNERLTFGCIGIGGKGSSDAADAARHGDIVAICDVDTQRGRRAAAVRRGAERGRRSGLAVLLPGAPGPHGAHRARTGRGAAAGPARHGLFLIA